MAEITVKGYVNKPASKESAKGGFSTFTLAERQKRKDGTFEKVYYDVIDFNHKEPPAESSFVTVKGWLSIARVEKNGRSFTNIGINAQELEVAPPREGGPSAAPGAAPAGAGSEQFDDIPF